MGRVATSSDPVQNPHLLPVRPAGFPVTLREVAPGIHLFDCPGLRASLALARCADHFAHERYGCCSGCQVGKAHAKQLSLAHKPRLPDTCCRCGRGGTRLIRGTHCASCDIRQREAVKGLNRKGSRPVKALAELRKVLVLTDGGRPGEFDRRNLAAALDPSAERIGTDGQLLEFVARDEREVRRVIAVRWPELLVADLEVGPTLAEASAHA